MLFDNNQINYDAYNNPMNRDHVRIWYLRYTIQPHTHLRCDVNMTNYVYNLELQY